MIKMPKNCICLPPKDNHKPGDIITIVKQKGFVETIRAVKLISNIAADLWQYKPIDLPMKQKRLCL